MDDNQYHDFQTTYSRKFFPFHRALSEPWIAHFRNSNKNFPVKYKAFRYRSAPAQRLRSKTLNGPTKKFQIRFVKDKSSVFTFLPFGSLKLISRDREKRLRPLFQFILFFSFYLLISLSWAWFLAFCNL